MASAHERHTSDAPSSDISPEPLAGVRVTVFLPVTLHAWLTAEANDDGLRVSTYIRRLVVADRRAKREE